MNETFPSLPTVGETPWHDKMGAWAAAVESRVERAEAGTDATAWEYYAAGRPDVVGTLDAAALAWRNAAPSGSTFYSTDGPQGAWVWRKRGATWVCVEGDTGLVPAGALLSNGWILGAGSCNFRRTANAVEYYISAINSVAATNQPFQGTIPLAWRTSNIRVMWSYGPGRSAALAESSIYANGSYMTGPTGENNATLLTRTFAPTGAWPTTLTL